MSCEIVCWACGRTIPEGCRFVERADGKTFCSDECDSEYDDAYTRHDEWLNELEIGDDVVVEQPSYRFRYYITTISDVTPAGIWAKGFPGVLFTDGECRIGEFEYLLLEPTDELLDKVNLINNRRRLEHIDWSKVDDDIVMDVSDLVGGD